LTTPAKIQQFLDEEIGYKPRASRRNLFIHPRLFCANVWRTAWKGALVGAMGACES